MRPRINIEKNSYVLFIVWMVLSWDSRPLNILLGGILSILISKLSVKIYYSHMGYHLHFPPLLKFFIFGFQVVRQMFIGTVKTLRRYGQKEICPQVFSYTLTTREPLKIAFLANAITLTPGTLTLDIKSGELKVLSLHHETKEALKEDIFTGLERYIL